MDKLTDNGFKVWLVGGAVRDLLLYRTPHDLDYVTDALPEQILSIYPDAIRTGERFGIFNVNGNDLATLRSDSIYSDGRHPDIVEFTTDLLTDLARRDFTINAMAQIPDGTIIDPYNGQEDLTNKVIKTVGSPYIRFGEDYLRMLRAVRFACQLDFNLHSDVMSAIQLMHRCITGTSVERIQTELIKMFNADPVKAFDLLHRTSLMRVLFPEVTACKGVEQPLVFHPEGCVYNHIRAALAHAPKGNYRVAFAALLHDIGKPATQKWNERKGRFQFIGHAEVSVKLARGILDRLKFSNADKDAILFAISKHMLMHDFNRMRRSKRYRLVAHPHWSTLYGLACADSGHILDLNIPARAEAFITGKDLIELGYEPSPLFSNVLNRIYENQLDGKIYSKERALQRVKELMAIWENHQ